jgi:hypothetical protein
MAFVCFDCTLPLITASAIELLVCSGVGGCLCPISSRMILMYTASLAIMYSPTNSASVAKDILCLIMWEMLSTAPLFGGIGVSLDRKKNVRLLNFVPWVCLCSLRCCVLPISCRQHCM